MTAKAPPDPARRFRRPEHRAVIAALRSMNVALLQRCRCWFGGGTAIVLDIGEYRLSKDIDFLCADVDGYREVRSALAAHGAAALFGPDIRQEREIRTDQYGVRTTVSVAGIPLRFEIIREARIALAGGTHPIAPVPCLGLVERVAEKLLANADRGLDPATGCRDALDLGMIARRYGPLPAEATALAAHAYGNDIGRRAAQVAAALGTASQRQHAADTLGMSAGNVDAAARAFRRECRRFWPSGDLGLPMRQAPA